LERRNQKKNLPEAISPGRFSFSCFQNRYVSGLYLYPYTPPFGDVILNFPVLFGDTGPTVAVCVSTTVPFLSSNSKFTV
jgi:hypothetical protein